MIPNNERKKNLFEIDNKKKEVNRNKNSLTNINQASNHLLSNYNLIKYNNIIFPRFIKSDNTNKEFEFLINYEDLKNQLKSFHQYLAKNKITYSTIFSNMFNQNLKLNSMNSEINWLNKENIYTTYIKDIHSFSWFSNNIGTILFVENMKKKRENNSNKEYYEDEKVHAYRGRKTFKRRSKKIHTKYCVDNILRKIQVNYLTFLIDYVNDIIGSVLPEIESQKYSFKHLEYNIKKCINLFFLNGIRIKSVGEILKMKETNKSVDTSLSNTKIYDYLCSLQNKVIDSIFNKTYVYMFENYFLKNENLYFFEGVKINLSLNTKKHCFSSLVADIGVSREKINDILKKYFIYGHRRYKNKFLIRK